MGNTQNKSNSNSNSFNKKIINFCGVIIEPNSIKAVTKEYMFKDGDKIKSGLLIILDTGDKIFIDINEYCIPSKNLKVMYDNFWKILKE